MNRQLVRLQQALRKPHLDSVLALVAAVEAKDVYTQNHSLHVAVFAEQIALAADLSAAQVELIRIAAILHDVGKIGIPDAILSKPGPLTPEELTVMRRHPSIGVTILQSLESVEAALPLILYHHENFDGSGYPEGLAGEEIPLGARVIRIADSLDAMTSPRVYKHALPLAVAIREIEKGRGTQFDPFMADVSLAWLGRTRNPMALLAQAT
jgi:putative nucleotidyltransferase with HDIG domain